ncbi:glycosyltransferase family 2 protein [Williamsia sp. R60]
MDMTVAVLTIVSGRHRHLQAQLGALAATSDRPDLHVVVAMDDPDIAEQVELGEAVVAHVARVEDRLPLALARNTAAAIARDRGADLLIFLDVDCIPAPDLVSRYNAAVQLRAGERLLFCGPVTYLDERASEVARGGGDLASLTAPHRARPNPPAGSVELGTDMNLFWSLSFAVTAASWTRIGGFFDGYAGYGGEDTDFAQMAASQRFEIAWVGGAHAYHQFHPVSNPPVEHLDDILLNANIFHARWGWWPMGGWLDGFAELGLVVFDTERNRWVRT